MNTALLIVLIINSLILLFTFIPIGILIWSYCAFNISDKKNEDRRYRLCSLCKRELVEDGENEFIYSEE